MLHLPLQSPDRAWLPCRPRRAFLWEHRSWAGPHLVSCFSSSLVLILHKLRSSFAPFFERSFICRYCFYHRAFFITGPRNTRRQRSAKNGHLCQGGRKARRCAQHSGTPLAVISGNRVADSSSTGLLPDAVPTIGFPLGCYHGGVLSPATQAVLQHSKVARRNR